MNAESSRQAMPSLMPVYDRADLCFERGEGPFLYDESGARYIDCVGGVAVTSLGHAHPRIVAALAEQTRKLWIVSNYFYNQPANRLAQRLVDMTFADTVFLQNSGVESWECAVKVMRKYFSFIGQPQRYRIISFEGCFHGRTLAAIAAAKTEKMVKGFGPMVDGFDRVAWGDLGAVRAAVTPETAGIMIEPVQGEGGMRAASADYLRGLRLLCDELGLLLAFDEIQCGVGRTGMMFAHEWYGVTPDVMCIAKALGNGFPVGACLATARAASGMTFGSHGTTYGGNPLAAAVANAVLDEMTRSNFMTGVVRTGEYLWSKLDELIARHPRLFVEHRGKGMMQGLRCDPAIASNAEVVKALREEKLLTLEAGDNVVRIMPSLIIETAVIDEAIAIMDKVAALWDNVP